MKLLKNGDSIYLDEGFQFGQGLFETLYVTPNGEGIFLKEHLKRLESSAKMWGFDHVPTKSQVEELIHNENIGNQALKIMLSKRNCFAMVRPMTYTKEIYEKGFHVGMAKTKKNNLNPMIYHKTVNYSLHMWERQQGLEAGYNEVVFTNEKGFLCEGTMTNIMVIKDDHIMTPAVSTGLLPGIMRQWMMDRFLIEEKRDLTKEDLINGDEIFLTNGLMGIMPVSAFEEYKKSTEVTQGLLAIYEKEIVEQGEKK